MNLPVNDNNELEELFHSMGASFVLISIYTVCLYIVAPIANILLNWYVSHFANIHDNSTLLRNVTVAQMTLRAGFAIICSGYAGFFAGLKIFPKQKTKHTILLSMVLVILVPTMLIDMDLNDTLQQINSTNLSK